MWIISNEYISKFLERHSKVFDMAKIIIFGVTIFWVWYIEMFLFEWVWGFISSDANIQALYILISFLGIIPLTIGAILHHLDKYILEPFKLDYFLKKSQTYTNYAQLLNRLKRLIVLKIQDVDEILKISQLLCNSLYKIKPILDIQNWHDIKDITIDRFIKRQINVALYILIDLHSDLSLRLIEQQKILTWAKEEVDKNIGWTVGLEEVSELQKARLDKQIEQFEELQRTLVRV